MNINILLLMFALVFFVIAAIGVTVPRFNFIAIGLAFWVLALLLSNAVK